MIVAVYWSEAVNGRSDDSVVLLGGFGSLSVGLFAIVDVDGRSDRAQNSHLARSRDRDGAALPDTPNRRMGYSYLQYYQLYVLMC